MNAFSARFTTIKSFLATQHWPPLSDWKNLFSGSYWGAIFVPASSPYVLLTTIVVIIILAVLIVWYFWAKRMNNQLPIYGQLIAQLPILIIFTAVVSLLYAFFRAQEIQYFSSHLVLLISSLILIVWSGYLIYLLRRVIPAKKQAHLEKERFFRYLPKSKR